MRSVSELKKSRLGFTLIELIIVIVILGILAAVAVPAYSGYVKKANQAADNTLLAAVNSAFSAACMENGEYDMRNLSYSGKPTATLAGGKVVAVNPYNSSFKFYFAGNENKQFQYYTALEYVGGVFVGVDGAGNLSSSVKSFKTNWANANNPFQGHEEPALKQYDEIARIFGGNLAKGLLSGVLENADLAPLVNGFGLDGLASVMNLTDDDLRSMVDTSKIEGYDTMSAEEKAEKEKEQIDTIRGNLAMLYLANDAAGQTTESVMQGLGNTANALMKAMTAGQAEVTETDEETGEEIAVIVNNQWSKDEASVAWFLKNADADTLSNYKNYEDEDEAAYYLDQYMSETDTSSAFGTLGFSRGQAVALQNAIGDGSGLSVGGASKIGAIYALAVGYQQSQGKDPLKTGSGTDMIKTISDSLLNEDNRADFLAYCGTEPATASIDAYLASMTVLSNKSGDIDLTDEHAYSGQYAYIADILGIKTTPSEDEADPLAEIVG